MAAVAGGRYCERRPPAAIRCTGALADLLILLFCCVDDRFHRASFNRLQAGSQFGIRSGLLTHVRMALLFVARKDRGGSFFAQIAINTSLRHEKTSSDVVRPPSGAVRALRPCGLLRCAVSVILVSASSAGGTEREKGPIHELSSGSAHMHRIVQPLTILLSGAPPQTQPKQTDTRRRVH